eukprot:4158666-Pyramimonas_sp.AAC.1
MAPLSHLSAAGPWDRSASSASDSGDGGASVAPQRTRGCLRQPAVTRRVASSPPLRSSRVASCRFTSFHVFVSFHVVHVVSRRSRRFTSFTSFRVFASFHVVSRRFTSFTSFHVVSRLHVVSRRSRRFTSFH